MFISCKEGRLVGLGTPISPWGAFPGLGQSLLPRSSAASHGDAGLASGPASLLVPREEGHRQKMLLGEGRRHRGSLGGTQALYPTYSSPLTFLFFSYRSFKSASSSFSSMKPLPSWVTREGHQRGQGHEPHKPTLGMGAGGTPKPSPSTAQGKPSTSPPNHSKELTQPKPCGFALALVFLFVRFGFLLLFLSVYLKFHFVLFYFLVDF